MSQEHELARQALRELVPALERWLADVASSKRDLSDAEQNLRSKSIVYLKLRKITGKYRFPPR